MPHKSYRGRVDVIPFAGATDLHQRLARSFALVTDWMGALTGYYDLGDVLATLAQQTQATTVSLYRIDKTEKKVHRIACHSRLSDGTSLVTNSGALAFHTWSQHGENMDSGTIWRATELAREPDFAGSPADLEWQARGSIIEASLIVLERAETRCDILEVRFETLPSRSDDIPSILVTRALADAWALKAPGVIDALISQEKRRHAAQPRSAASIFDGSNPYGLTRAEIVVCRLLAHGQMPKDIADSLGLSIATVRTHLRNLYSKTGSSGQVSLIALVQQDRVSDD